MEEIKIGDRVRSSLPNGCALHYKVKHVGQNMVTLTDERNGAERIALRSELSEHTTDDKYRWDWRLR